MSPANPGAAGPPEASEPLAPEDAARLTEFARACKAAVRAVTLYPGAHPAIAATLGRIVQITSPENMPAPMKITVLAHGLKIDGRTVARPDSSIAELATLLHDHLIGEITISPGGDVEAWRSFLLLLGRTPDGVRADGGIARLWATTAGTHLALKEIDYAEVLRERRGDPAAWDRFINGYVEGLSFEPDSETAKWLLEIAADAKTLGDLFVELESRAADAPPGVSRAGAFIKLLQGIVKAVQKMKPEELDTVLRNMASAIGRLSPEMLVSLLSEAKDFAGGAEVVDAVVTRVSEGTIASFVARNVTAEDSSLDRVAQAFHTLVRDDVQQERMLSLAHDEAAASPAGQAEGFEAVWNSVAQKLMTSYSDKPFVSDSYARELSTSRTQAVTIDQIADDPPERMNAWLGTVATSELRELDLTLVRDLLRIEKDDQIWGSLMPPIVSLLEDLLLVGDFEPLIELTGTITAAATEGTKERQQHALIAIDLLVSGAMMRHLVTHLSTVDDAQFDRIKTMCGSMGEVLVRPLAELLSTDVSDRARDRLTAILIGFGQVGRQHVERLKSSRNAAVRRTALVLLREFGGQGALPELTELLNDSSVQIQREAVRAILNIGSERAYEVIQRALVNGSAQSRDAIMKSLSAARDSRAVLMFGHILRNVDHKGPLADIYLHAIESLGALKHGDGVAPLKEALYRGEWWAPRRTAALRGAAAAALGRIGTTEAFDALEEAMAGGPRGVRTAVRPVLANAGARRRGPRQSA